ncbi:AbiJ-NTD4 domain-containing protein [Rhizobium ruizarguesonis]
MASISGIRGESVTTGQPFLREPLARMNCHMLTDVFITRYENTPIWASFDELTRRFMVQAGKLLTEQLFPFYVDGNENKAAKATLQKLHDTLAMELGIDPLSALYNGGYRYPISDILKNFLQRPYEQTESADVFIKRRISLVELGFREFERNVKAANAALPGQLAELRKETPLYELARSLKVSALSEEFSIKHNKVLNDALRENMEELNERFRQAKFPLAYHNGFIQLSSDTVISNEIDKPFWALVSGERWKNVERDMLEAVDRRDNKGRDPALYAAKALESAIKIISGEKGWTRGNENGAAAYIDNLISQKNGRFTEVWEGEALKAFFSKVRNPLGHGPGNEEMPELTTQQDDWAIETCMSWIKSLIRRL